MVKFQIKKFTIKNLLFFCQILGLKRKLAQYLVRLIFNVLLLSNRLDKLRDLMANYLQITTLQPETTVVGNRRKPLRLHFQ